MRERSGDGAWSDVYRIETALAVVAVVAILLLLRHRESAPTRTGAGGAGFDTLRKMPGWMALTGSYASYGFCYLLAVSFLTSRLEDDAGYSEGLASTMFTLVGIGTIAGGVLLGIAADRFGERATLTVGFAVFAAALAGIMTGAVAVVAVGAICVGLMFGGLAAVTAGYVVGHTTAEAFGPSYAAATFAFGIAQVSAPQVGGIIADATGNFTVVFLLSIAFALTGSFASSRLPTRPASSPSTP